MSLAFQNGAAHNAVMDFGKDSVWARLAATLRSIFPHKTAENIAAYTGLQTRSAEFFLSRKSTLNSDAVVSLLQTKHAGEVLRALMGEDQFKLMWERERLRFEIEKLEREMSKK